MPYPSQNQNQTAKTSQEIDHLRHENYILLEQIKSKDSILKMILAETNVIFGAISPDKTINYLVGKGLEHFNINVADILGRSIYDAIKPLPDLQLFLESSLEGKPIQKKISLGDSKPYKFSSMPVADEEGKLLHVFILAFPE